MLTPACRMPCGAPRHFGEHSIAVFAVDDGFVELSLPNGRATGRDVMSDPFVFLHHSQLCIPERRGALCPSPPRLFTMCK